MAELIGDRIRERLNALHMIPKDVLEHTDLTSGNLSMIMSGKNQNIKSNTLLQLATVLKCDLLWLLTGETGRPVRTYEDDEAPPNGMVAVKEFNVTLKAGYGAPDPTYEEEHESRPTWYHEDFFRRLGINPKNCKRLKVSGDSMEPLINDGDWILVDCTIGQPVIDGEIYAFCQAPDGLRVKRVFKPLRGGMIIHSDNPRYPDETYEEGTQVNFYLIGRVLERSGAIV